MSDSVTGAPHLEVISCLADKFNGKAKNAVVPYRNSKLTMILERGLEGSGRCSTVATLTPSMSAVHGLHSAFRLPGWTPRGVNCGYQSSV